MRSKVRKGQVAIAAGLVAVVLGAMTTSALGQNPNYEFWNVSVQQVDESHALVTYDYGWSTEDFPGWRSCTWTVYDSSGAAVGQETLQLIGLSPSYAGREKLIAVAGEASSAEAVCPEEDLSG